MRVKLSNLAGSWLSLVEFLARRSAISPMCHDTIAVDLLEGGPPVNEPLLRVYLGPENIPTDHVIRGRPFNAPRGLHSIVGALNLPRCC